MIRPGVLDVLFGEGAPALLDGEVCLEVFFALVVEEFSGAEGVVAAFCEGGGEVDGVGFVFVDGSALVVPDAGFVRHLSGEDGGPRGVAGG